MLEKSSHLTVPASDTDSKSVSKDGSSYGRDAPSTASYNTRGAKESDEDYEARKKRQHEARVARMVKELDVDQAAVDIFAAARQLVKDNRARVRAGC